MSQVNSVKDLRDKHTMCLVQNKGQTTLIDIKKTSYSRPRTTKVPYVGKHSNEYNKKWKRL